MGPSHSLEQKLPSKLYLPEQNTKAFNKSGKLSAGLKRGEGDLIEAAWLLELLKLYILKMFALPLLILWYVIRKRKHRVGPRKCESLKGKF
jgi:hypothetical protein